MSTVAEREFECPARRGPCCGLIDMAIGWRQPVEMEVCDSCLSVGGTKGCAASDVRVKYIQLCITNLKARGLQDYPPQMGIVVMDRHATPAEMGAIEAQVRESKRRAKIGPTFKRWGITWRGIRPWYEWPHRCAWTGMRSAWWELQRLWRGGCGCRKVKL